MKSSLDIRFRNTHEVIMNINKLGKRLATNASRSGLRAGAQVLRRRVRETVPEDTGYTRENVKVHMRKPYEHRGITISVRMNAYQSHLIELGTRMRYTQSGASRGMMPAFHTMLLSLEETFPQSFAAIMAQLRKWMIQRGHWK